MTHDGIRPTMTKMFTHIETIIHMVELINGVGDV